MEKDPKLVKRGRAARLRGQRAEREVCDILTRITGEKHCRNLGQARDSGSDVDFGPFLLEVKFQNRLKMPEWLEQADATAKARDMLSALVFRRDGEKWKVVLDFEVFAQIVNGLRGRDGAEADHGNTGSDPDGRPLRQEA